jgi:uncharacterized protein
MARIETAARLREIIADYGPRGAAKYRDHICDQGAEFVARCPFVMLATQGDYGIEVSQKGGDPGFVTLDGIHTMLIPEYQGNHLAVGLSNILVNPGVGLALIRPATDEVLRVTGQASLHDDSELCERMSAGGKPALLVIKVDVERAAFHCVRSARRAGLWNPAAWDVPTRISFGRIYAEALDQPELEAPFDSMTAESDAKLY